MANLSESDEFPAGIYQLEDTDPVKGGAPNEATKAGVDNIPHQQLARRTRWLKTRVDTLLASVVAASTTVAGIVRLTDSVTSASTTTAATANAAKAANDNANARAYKATTITGAGLATGGGALDANRMITVPVASQAEAEAGTAADKAMTPQAVAQALAVHGVPAAAAVTNLNDVIGSGFAAANVAPANSPWDYPGVMTVRRANQRMGQIAVPTNSAGARLAARSQSATGVWGAWLEAWLGQPAAQSLGTSGYQRLPSGLLIQWGQFTGTTSATLANNGVYESDPVTVTWPVAFTTLFQVIPGASADVTGFGQQEQVWRRSAGLTSGSFAVASRTSGATMTGSYLVIGV